MPRTHQTTRARIGGVFAVTAALLLTGCSLTAEATPETTQAHSFPGIYHQTVEWGSCETGFKQDDTRAVAALAHSDVNATDFQCATVEAPLDWNDPSNHNTIELAVSKLPATGDNPQGSLFLNPGGPGESGVIMTYRFAGMDGTEAVRNAYDVVGVDPRGVGLSTPLACEQNSYVREIVYATCADEQPLARSMSTSHTARDLELVRVLEGDTQFNYLGYSYGTVLGATYATLFPDTVGRMVLDSALGDQWATPLGRYHQLISAYTEADLLLANCGIEYTVTHCPVRSVDEIFNLLPEGSPANGSGSVLVATDGYELNAHSLYGFVLSSMYGPPERRIAGLNTLAAAIGGEQPAIDEIAQEMNAGGASVDLAGQIITCHSQPHDPNVIGFLEAVQADGVPVFAGGSENTEAFIADFVSVPCAALAETGTDLQEFGGPEDTTILMVGITGDHAAPFDAGVGLSNALANTRFVTLEGHGHVASFASRSVCVDRITEAFLLDGVLPEPDTHCRVD